MDNQHVIAYYEEMSELADRLAHMYEKGGEEQAEERAVDLWFEFYLKANQNKRLQRRWTSCDEHMWAYAHHESPFQSFY